MNFFGSRIFHKASRVVVMHFDMYFTPFVEMRFLKVLMENLLTSFQIYVTYVNFFFLKTKI